jgi:tetratricopeptide (TPR) repeat protein
VRALSRLVFSLLQAEQTDEAESIAKETIRLYPNSTAGYVDLAYVCLNANRSQEALDTALKALEISPIDAEAYRVKAIVHSNRGDTSGADQAFDTALQLDPTNPEIIRDYYHHLRETGRYDQMERRVQQVIDMEHPYCIEDYWFLADHYRGQGKNLRAFHYLHKAHKSMPGDRELIAPLVDIMLDEGHASYSIPYLLGYIDRMGWDETMNDLARHRRLRGGKAQETMRLLRFLADRGPGFRSYIFARYFRRFLLMSLVLLVPLLAAFLYIPFGAIGALGGTFTCLLALIAVLVGPAVLHRLPRIPRPARNDAGG